MLINCLRYFKRLPGFRFLLWMHFVYCSSYKYVGGFSVSINKTPSNFSDCFKKFLKIVSSYNNIFLFKKIKIDQVEERHLLYESHLKFLEKILRPGHWLMKHHYQFLMHSGKNMLWARLQL